MTKQKWLCGILACLALLAAAAGAQTFDVKTTTLKNGLKVLVQEDHTIPNVAMSRFTASGRAMSVRGPRASRTSLST